jgi:hypothetical protein
MFGQYIHARQMKEVSEIAEIDHSTADQTNLLLQRWYCHAFVLKDRAEHAHPHRCGLWQWHLGMTG